MPVSKNQIVWSNENYINCYDFILSLLIPCSARRAPYTFFAVYLLHFFHFKWMLINFRFIKNEWVNRFDWIDNSIDSMNLFNEIHFIIVDHFQFYKQYSCNSCEAMLFNNQFKRGQKKNINMPTNRWTRRNNSTIKIDSFERNHWEFERIKETNYRASRTNSSCIFR